MTEKTSGMFNTFVGVREWKKMRTRMGLAGHPAPMGARARGPRTQPIGSLAAYAEPLPEQEKRAGVAA